MAKLVAFDRARTELMVGAILPREWNGVTHRVIVVDGGFLWDGSTYESLSKVAFAITGTCWSGPRFFGFSSRRTSRCKARALQPSPYQHDVVAGLSVSDTC